MKENKPSEIVVRSAIDGREITDSSGRKIVLRKPNALDKYYLAKAMGDDAKNEICLRMMFPLIYIAKIDGLVFETPKTYGECLAGLKRLEEEGSVAVSTALEEEFLSEEDEKESIKK